MNNWTSVCDENSHKGYSLRKYFCFVRMIQLPDTRFTKFSFIIIFNKALDYWFFNDAVHRNIENSISFNIRGLCFIFRWITSLKYQYFLGMEVISDSKNNVNIGYFDDLLAERMKELLPWSQRLYSQTGVQFFAVPKQLFQLP